jgi:hypothetical protein
MKRMIQKIEKTIPASDLEKISERVIALAIEDPELIEDEEATIDNIFQDSQVILQSLTDLASKIESKI